MSSLQRIVIATATAFALGAVDASARGLPQYEFAGFPISPLQIAVLGLGGVQERSAAPTLTLNGMPASPHQIAVIRPRTEKRIVKKGNTDVSSQARGPIRKSEVMNALVIGHRRFRTPGAYGAKRAGGLERPAAGGRGERIHAMTARAPIIAR
jgi:hypothetical protein